MHVRLCKTISLIFCFTIILQKCYMPEGRTDTDKERLVVLMTLYFDMLLNVYRMLQSIIHQVRILLDLPFSLLWQVYCLRIMLSPDFDL